MGLPHHDPRAKSKHRDLGGVVNRLKRETDFARFEEQGVQDLNVHVVGDGRGARMILGSRA